MLRSGGVADHLIDSRTDGPRDSAERLLPRTELLIALDVELRLIVRSARGRIVGHARRSQGCFFGRFDFRLRVSGERDWPRDGETLVNGEVTDPSLWVRAPSVHWHRFARPLASAPARRPSALSPRVRCAPAEGRRPSSTATRTTATRAEGRRGAYSPSPWQSPRAARDELTTTGWPRSADRFERKLVNDVAVLLGGRSRRQRRLRPDIDRADRFSVTLVSTSPTPFSSTSEIDVRPQSSQSSPSHRNRKSEALGFSTGVSMVDLQTVTAFSLGYSFDEFGITHRFLLDFVARK